MTTLAIIALTAFAVFALAGVLVLRFVWRSLRQVRARMFGARSYVTAPGPRRDAITLRRRLADEMRSSRQMLTAAPEARMFQAQAGPVLIDILTTAGGLDAELAEIERFVDPGQQRAALALVAPQVQQLIDTSYSARQTILRTAAADRERDLASLRDTVANEAASLASYQRSKDDLAL
ncbi:hypothetical protein SAMN05892883_3786 [Jatrophihabitans sp. GAS493]|uniref:hypothetical protein n=1 Tax=Jatrophihabitans sp. GAS493 TaxID=1907575 RepID=UPI000BB6BFFF|nr:hypothetical protein [Jatrophihabitans sp. GAS493]SOD74600.1 hypothetical protein SAMN05892883_3786 [Jatrophihabitans sp. GAS493]